ncbi:MAG TPA: membrane protein insertase YidC [Actinobacteria bacterium]|nr:membrane protein insertase YidC [Actinomycetota bacterium]
MFIFDWLKDGVSWVLVQIHQFLSLFMNPDSGWTWTFAIVGLVVVIRILLIPLFVKQINSQRNLQLIQPQMKEIQKKYAGDREKQSAEMMKLYKETGTNPLASCLPILLQAPIFFALFSVLNGIAQYNPTDVTYTAPGVFAWSQYANLVPSMHDAQIFGVPLYGTFMDADGTPNPTATHILCVVLIILMTATTFLTQRQLIVKNSAPDNPMVKQQKILLYVFPIMFMISGINFPIGVLIYWFTTNLWSMGQQFYVIRNNPQPGTPAFEAKEARAAVKANRKLGIATHEVIEGVVVDETVTPRVQPKKTSRSQRKRK